jgi:hypothetical protein
MQLFITSKSRCQEAYEDPYRREAICMQNMWEKIFRLFKYEEACSGALEIRVYLQGFETRLEKLATSSDKYEICRG